MTKQERRMDLLYTIVELWINKEPIFIDLTLDLWNFLSECAGLRKVDRGSDVIGPLRFMPMGFVSVFLTNNGDRGKIYLSYHPQAQTPMTHKMETVEYPLEYDD